MDSLESISEGLASLIAGRADISAESDAADWEEISSARLELLVRLTQVITDNLRERQALSPPLEEAGHTVSREAQRLLEMSGRVDRCLQALRQMVMERLGALPRLEALQRALPELMDGALQVCQVQSMADLESWLRRDRTVGEVCRAVGCELIDPQEGDEFSAETMYAAQSELTADETLAGRVSACVMPGVQVKYSQSRQPEIRRQALVSVFTEAAD
ncbi:hypothetical protein IJT17_04460 [bacterium]|nr:hypothetical protein [bacterium]